MPGSSRLRALTALATVVAIAAAGLVSAGPASADPDPAPAPAPDPSLTSAPVDPGSRLTEFPLPNPSSLPNDVLAGADGSVWVSTFADKQVLRMSRDGAITTTAQLTGGPSSLATDGEGGAWAAEYASNAIAHISASGVVTEYSIPTANSFPAQVYDAGDLVFFTESNTGQLGRLTQSTGAIVEYPIAGATTLWAIAGVAGVDDRLLVSDTEDIVVRQIAMDGTELRRSNFGGYRGITQISGLQVVDGVYSGIFATSYAVSRFDWNSSGTNSHTPVVGRSRIQGAADQGGRVWVADADTKTLTASRAWDKVRNVDYSVPATGDLSNPAVTDGRFIWTADRAGGRLWRLDSVVDIQVVRHGGADRYDLASALVHEKYPSGSDTVFVASGETFPDALSVGPIAAALAAPLLLSPQASLPASVRGEIVAQHPKRVFVVGGPASLSESLLKEIQGAVPAAAIERIGGADRFAVSRALQARGLIVANTKDLYLADGRNFPDALSAAPLAGRDHTYVTLVNGAGASLDETDVSLIAGYARVSIVGGSNSVSTGIEKQLLVKMPGGVLRVGGADRFAVSNTLASRFVPGYTGTAYLANGSAFADALSGGAVAGSVSAPLLLAHRDCVPSETLSAMLSLGVSRVELLGGENTLNSDVLALKECA